MLEDTAFVQVQMGRIFVVDDIVVRSIEPLVFIVEGLQTKIK